MRRLRKVAIVGAGPSGLVIAKTLLHNYPEGTFKPTVFEKARAVGGLWSVKPQNQSSYDRLGSGKLRHENGNSPSRASTSPSTSFISPWMLTNLSRFTVSFSDLAWESVDLNPSKAFSAHENPNECSTSRSSSLPPPLFPKAWQVGRYLETYSKRYLPPEILRLGCQVIRTERKSSKNGSETGWVVEWSENRNNGDDVHPKGENIKREEFDYLVVASGYFSVPHIPKIAGLSEFHNRIVHSSALRDVDNLLESWNNSEPPFPSSSPPLNPGKLIVVGGSFSAAEAASTLALHISSLTHPPQGVDGYQDRNQRQHHNLVVHHIAPRPFWIVPTLLPSVPQTNTSSVTFLPMDLIMYDLSRRPPGEIHYAFGAIPPQRSIMVNDYLESLVGTDQTGLGDGSLALPKGSEIRSRPPWIALDDSYAGYLRSGQIKVTIGRLGSISVPGGMSNTSNNGNALGKLEIESDSGGKMQILDNVVGVVFATGFRPFPSLSFLPPEVRSRLEYTEDDSYLTIVLDDKGVSHTNIPDLGFVGFYRGAFWGVAEMQARSLAEKWMRYEQQQFESRSQPRSLSMSLANFNTGINTNTSNSQGNEPVRQKYYELRKADPKLERAQFPMGDYVGLMESFARELGIKRIDVTPEKEGERTGPVAPARYQTLPVGSSKNNSNSQIRQLAQRDAELTLQTLRATLSLEYTSESRQYATSKAIFQAFQGRWAFKRRIMTSVTDTNDPPQSPNNEFPRDEPISGTAIFHPRYPTSTNYDSEYLYEEIIQQQRSPSPAQTVRSEMSGSGNYSSNNTSFAAPKSVFRFREVSEPGVDGVASHIGVWTLSNINTEGKGNKNSDGSYAKSNFSHHLHVCWRTGESIAQRDNWEIEAVGRSQPPNQGRPTSAPASVDDGAILNYSHIYTVTFQGVYIVSWKVKVVLALGENDHDNEKEAGTRKGNRSAGLDRLVVVEETVYRRGTEHK